MIGSRDVVTQVISQFAPDEEILVDSYDPEASGSVASGPLGFGLSHTILLLTPIVWKIVDPMLEEMSKTMSKAFAEKLLRVLQGGVPAHVEDAKWTRSMTSTVSDKLREAGVDEARNAQIAEGIVKICLTAQANA